MASFNWRSRLAAVLALGLVAGCGLGTPAGQGLDPFELSQLQAKVKANGTTDVVVTYHHARELTELAEAGFDLWGVDGTHAKGTANAESLKVIQRLNLQVQAQGRAPRNEFDPGYKNVEQIEADLKALAAKYPDIAKLEDFGDSWEKGHGKPGHDLYVLKIGRGDLKEKPGVIFLGNHHAREIVTPEIVLNLAHLLLEGYGKDPELTAAVDNRAIYLVPTVNPDGHVLAEQGNDWRKNANTTLDNSPFSDGPYGPGIDLNRNYGYKWGGAGASARPSDPTFRGPSAFSEPETMAVRDLIKSRKFDYLMTYHSFSNLVLWPWGFQNAPPPDKRLPAVGMKLAELSKYKGQQSKDLYMTAGDTTDWAFGELGILSYTIEIGSYYDNFDPPFSQMSRFWNENKSGALYVLKTADHPEAVFGPELTRLRATDGQIRLETKAPIKQLEAFIGHAGAPGTGFKVTASGTQALLKMPSAFTEARQVLLVRAQGLDGQWGPAEAVWSR